MSSKKEQSPSMTAAKYADILHLARPKPSHLHPRMQVENRAKIFSPFAALRGYEEEIAEEGWKKTRVSKKELSEEDIDRLSGLLRRIRSGMTVTVRYFQEDTVHPASPPLGIFCELTVRVERIDPVFQTLHLSDGTVRTDIRFEDLDDIDIL